MAHPEDMTVHVGQLSEHAIELVLQVAVLQVGLRVRLGGIGAGADVFGGQGLLLRFQQPRRILKTGHRFQIALQRFQRRSGQREAVHSVAGAQVEIDQGVKGEVGAQGADVQHERLTVFVATPVPHRHQRPHVGGQQGDGLVFPRGRIAASLRHLGDQHLGQRVRRAVQEGIEGIGQPLRPLGLGVDVGRAGEVVQDVQVVLAPARPRHREKGGPQRRVALAVHVGTARPPEQSVAQRQTDHRGGFARARAAEQQEMGAGVLVG